MSARKGLTLAMAIGAVGVVVLALQASCRSAPPVGGVGVVLPSVEVQVPPPVLRVGVVVEASRVSIAADSGVRLWRPGNSAAPVTDRWFARVTFAPIPPATAPGPRFQIQAGSFRDEQGARAMAQKASRAAGRPAATRWNEDARAYQLRVGDWPTRKEAEGVLARLGQAGLAGAYVVEEPTPGRCRLLESGEEFARVMVVPAHAGEDLSVDGLTYRGLVEVLAIGGGVTAVNLVNAEDYLRGVVPNELSPQAFPQLEALKAQAIAARSYAFRNRGQYRAHGFDICATQACQVYRGKSTEQPLTDQAVAATRGLVAKYGEARMLGFFNIVVRQDKGLDNGARTTFGQPWSAVDQACVSFVRSA